MHRRIKFRRYILLVFFATGLLLAIGPAAAETGPLARLEIHSAAQRQALAAAGVQIYARLYTDEGQEVLIMPENELQRSPAWSPLAASADLQILDRENQPGRYFLVRLSDEALLPELQDQQQSSLEVLGVFGPQAVVKADPQVMETLHDEGVHAMPLELHPLHEVTTALRSPEIDGVDPYIQFMVNQVRQENLIEHIRRLSGEAPVTVGSGSYFLTTRFTPNETAITRATRYVHDYLEGLGLQASYHYYYLVYNGWAGERRNVVAEQRGVLHPEQVLYITAHMDSRRENDSLSFSLAPGADDNASGTAAVLTAAEVLSQHTFAYTIRYVLFTGEEQIMKGSGPYVSDLAAAGDEVLGVLNLDMIAYDSGGVRQFELHTRPGEAGDDALARTFRDVIRHYGLNLDPVIIADALSFSDHSSFWQYDYPAVLAMEDWGNPNWHKTTDTVNTLDAGYYTQAVRAAVGTIAHLAEFHSPNLSGVVTTNSALAPLAGAQVTFSGQAGGFTALTDAAGAFTLMIPGGVYDLSVQAAGYAADTQPALAVPDPLTGEMLVVDSDLCQLLDRLQVRGEGLPAHAGQPVTFSLSPHAGSPPVQYHWETDGWLSDQPTITVVFDQAGSYPLSVSATNACGTLQSQRLLLVDGQPLYLPVTIR